ncbi:MAG: nitroreductase family protein [Candidatus Aminicenantes bacterium]|nr:MAG: nitroreductase family protein [Candidatus Aminicenantes bacterium]
MSLYDLIISRRSIRQFKTDPISQGILRDVVNAGRLAPSAANRQPLEFIVVDEESKKKHLFSCLKWAGYIAPEGNPKPGQEPQAYIVVLVNTDIREKGFEWDSGAAIENMILAAWGKGIGSCWIISMDKDRVKEALGVPDSHKVDSVVAFGYPAEVPVIEDMKDSIKYWKDERECLHVPKRKLEDVIRFNKF